MNKTGQAYGEGLEIYKDINKYITIDDEKEFSCININNLEGFNLFSVIDNNDAVVICSEDHCEEMAKQELVLILKFILDYLGT